MQESNLSSKIFPSLVVDWSSFIQKTQSELEKMMTNYNKDKQRIRDLERVINKINEIVNACKDNYRKILNHRELFIYIDKDLESSFDALEFFEKEDDFDNDAVKSIYNKIINSKSILDLTSEYHSLVIKVQFDRERTKRLSALISGTKIDFTLIRELLKKYKFDDNKKKNILFYPVVMLAVRQNEKDNKEEIKESIDRSKEYQDRFNQLCQDYHHKKEEFNSLLVRCYNVREKMTHQELNTYYAFVNNPIEMRGQNFDDETRFKIYTLAFFKVKNDLEKLITSISELAFDEKMDGELDFLNEEIMEFESLGNILNSFEFKNEQEDESETKVFFALDAFNHLIVNEDIISPKNRSNLKALFEKAEGICNSHIEGVKTNAMLGVDDAEKILGKNISMLTTSKMRLAYIVVNKNILIIQGTTNSSVRFDKLVRIAVARNIVSIREQIRAIMDNDADYLESENAIIKRIMGETEVKQKAI